MLQGFLTRCCCLCLTLLTLAPNPHAAGAELRFTTHPAIEPRPILVTADEATAWNDGNLQMLLLKGNVHVEQGLLRAKMDQAVVWMAGTVAQKGKPLTLTIYGEGRLDVDQAGTRSMPDQALFELRTQDTLRLKAGRTNQTTAEQSATDPFFRRAVIQRGTLQAEPVPAEPVPARPAGVDTSRIREVEAIPTQAPRERPNPAAADPRAALADGRPAYIRIAPRNNTRFDFNVKPAGPNQQIITITGGVQVFVDDRDRIGLLDMSTDRAVVWLRNVDAQGFLSGTRLGDGTDGQIEVYLEGHVELRQESVLGKQAGQSRLLKADQAYYDVSRNVALLLNAELVASQPGIPNDIHLRAQEIRQTAANRFEASQAAVYSSRLPSDPDLFIRAQATGLELREAPVRGLFGRTPTDESGNELTTTQLYGAAEDITLNALDVPIFYWPRIEGDLRDPLGPLEQVRFKADRIFGFGLLVDWDLFYLLGIDAPPGSRWRLETDYLSERGPALGTQFETAGFDLFDLPGRYQTLARGYVISDSGRDRLGPFRDGDPPRELRGRFLFRHRQEIAPDLTFLGQFNYISDRNFLEQFYKREFEEEFVQETFAYLKKQEDFWAVSILAQPNIRGWVTSTEWLPRVDGHVVGLSLFDRLTYFARASGGYANLEPSGDITPAYLATPFPLEFQRTRPLPPASDLPHHSDIDLARLDLWQELDLPLDAGPVRIVPYGILDLTHWTDTLTSDPATRVYGGGGMRASIPFTRIYPEVCNDLLNVNGIAHKITLHGDYRYVQSNQNFRELPLLDRIDDDATDQARRDLRLHRLLTAVPGSSEFNLATSPLYDPQLYALRRGLESSVENLDDLQVLRLGVRQRWQTKRGPFAHEHIIDWITLDLRGTWFPDADRDNFGHPFAFLDYDFTWHIGDRTTLLSAGWVDPYADGPRVWNIGMFVERPERLNFYLGYRHIDPVGSQAVILSNSLLLSPKYAMSFRTTYDFGRSESLGNALIFTRIGTDIQVSFGITYDALRSSLGFTFEILPALGAGKVHGLSNDALTQAGFGR